MLGPKGIAIIGNAPLGQAEIRNVRLGRPKGVTAENPPKRILNAAEALFVEGGYDGTSMRDIADLAHLKPSCPMSCLTA